MTTAELFDGTVLEFPDGTPQEVISKTVKRETLKARVSSGDMDSKSGAPAYVRALVGGAPTKKDRLLTMQKFFPGAIEDPDDPDNFIFINPETGQPTLYNPRGFDAGDVPSLAREGVQAAGGIVGAAKGSPLGVPGMIGGAGLGAAAGEEAFNLTAQQAGMSDTRTMGDRATDTAVIGVTDSLGQGAGMSVQALISTALKTMLRGGGKQATKEAAGHLADFEAVGAKPTAGQVTEGRATRNIEGVLSKAPGGAGRFANKAQETITKIDEFVAKRSQGLSGGSRLEPEVAGRKIAEGISGDGGFVSRFKNKAGELYDAIKIAPDSPVPVDRTAAYLSDATAPIKGAENISKTKLIKNSLLEEINSALKADLGSGAIPYAALKELRSRIGARLASPSLVDDIPRGELKKLYAAISSDLEAAAKQAGPEAKKAFERANSFYKAGIKRIDDVLQPLVNKDIPEKIFRALEVGGRDGATTIRSVVRSLNKQEHDLLAGTVLSRLGKATPGQQGATGEVFSVETYLTNWNKLSKETKDALFGGTSLKSLRRDLDTVARVAEQIRESARAFANPSGSAGSVVGQSLAFVGGGSALVGVFTGDAASLGLAGTLAAGGALANVGARLLTNQRFVKWLATGVKMKPNSLGAHIGRLGAIAAASDEQTREDIKTYLSLLSQEQPEQ